MSIAFETVLHYAKNPVELCEWVDSLSKEEAIEVLTIMNSRRDDLFEAMEEWAAEVGPEGIDKAINVVATSNARDISKLMELEEQYENQYGGIDCTEANEIINRVKKGASK
jgi:hypothetical protein